MKPNHVPAIDGRYWTAILLASVFGTNLGDLYAHESGFGIALGLALLALLAAAAFVAERLDRRSHEIWYWTVIIIIRTGATNIADYLAFRVRIPQAILAIGLAILIAAFGRAASRSTDRRVGAATMDTGAPYWIAMLSAGVFGTVVGDVCSHAVGQLPAALSLFAAFAVALTIRSRGLVAAAYAYWLAVAVARTAGTSLGDWIAESPLLGIGLPVATLISGIAFVALLSLVRGRTASGGQAAIELR